MIGPYPTNSRSGTSPAPVPYPQGEPQERLALPLLVDAFVQASATDPSGDLSKRPRKGDLHFLASVFANITTVGDLVTKLYINLCFVVSRRSHILLPALFKR